ncbi:MAG TPA: YihY/virulence factor BrkB family protein [Microthrixaceae bacterium]|nr:YihY/virulence factor BrkB family protein [Microthrixaceae bacterium]HMT23240.1 YihY/virulence factor BrkB family protein [Microthrixaceae bacterium]HMT59329.1 YihY/virulence factor BrkB family protein [Microthrixaceae bacterium]
MAKPPSPLKLRADRIQRDQPVLGFIYGVVKKYGDDKGANLSALITYYGFFSMFPLLLVAFTILGFVLDGKPELRADISQTLAERFPLGIDPKSIGGSGLALAVGVVLALWSGLGATQVTQDALNTVWNVPRRTLPNFIVKRLRGLMMLGVLGGGIVAGTAVSSVVSALGPAARIGGYVGAGLVNAIVIALLFKLMVEQPLTWRDVAPGALFGGIGWTVLASVGTWYTRRLVDNADKTYGTFAVVIGLLSFIYLQAQVLVYAAEVSVVASRRLWPRALVVDDPTDADIEVARAIARRAVDAGVDHIIDLSASASVNSAGAPPPTR